MDCPGCKRVTAVEVDTHSDGYGEGIMECGHCGTIWQEKEGTKVILVKGCVSFLPGTQLIDCPFCHATKQVELDMHSDGFAEDLRECGECGSVWTGMRENLQVVHGPTWPRTLKLALA